MLQAISKKSVSNYNNTKNVMIRHHNVITFVLEPFKMKRIKMILGDKIQGNK